MEKKVEYKGKNYTISTRDYGYDSQKLAVNGEDSSKTIENDDLQNIPSYSSAAISAIKEYIARHKAANRFKEWDGKLD